MVDRRPVVAEFETGEWLRYTLTAETAGERPVTVIGAGGRVSLSLNGGTPVTVDLPAGDGWHEAATPALPFLDGTNTLILKAEACAACRVEAMQLGPR